MLEGPDGGMRIDRTRAGAMAIVSPRGELDHASGRQLSAAVQATLTDSPLILAIDLRDVTFTDGGTIGTLIEIGQRCTAEGRRMLLVRGNAQIDRLLIACGLEGHFDVVAGLDQVMDLGGHEPASPSAG